MVKRVGILVLLIGGDQEREEVIIVSGADVLPGFLRLWSS